MRPIPAKLREQLAGLERMKQCARHDSHCFGRIEWEHVWIYAGKQINEVWAIIGLCEYHHRGEGLDKEINRYLSIMLAVESDFMKYPRTDWRQIKQYLQSKYGTIPNDNDFKRADLPSLF